MTKTIYIIGRSAAEVLMNVTYKLPEKLTGDVLRAYQRLYNDLMLTLLMSGGQGNIIYWVGICKALSNALWYLDPHHATLHERGIGLPIPFQKFSGYSDYKRRKKKTPRMSQSGLDQHVQTLCKFLLQPWFCHSKYYILRSHTETLVSGMKKYQKFLEENSERNSMQQHSTELIHSQIENVTTRTVPPSSELKK